MSSFSTCIYNEQCLFLIFCKGIRLEIVVQYLFLGILRLPALCTMGYYQDALNRMKLRYRAMIESPLTTLWEGWGIGSEGFGGGTYNHAWSGGPLTILSQYIAGIETLEPAFRMFRVAPHPAHLNFIRTLVPLSGGRRIVFEMDKSAHSGTHVPASTGKELPHRWCFLPNSSAGV